MSSVATPQPSAPPVDSYTWVVHYRDGSTIGQINNEHVDDGSWRKVDVRNVAFIRLDPSFDHLPYHGIFVPDGAIAYLTFERGHALDMNTGIQTPNPVMIIAGWTRGNESSYLFVDPDGNGMVSTDRYALHKINAAIAEG